METAARYIIEAVGEDPNRRDLKRTPKRVARAYRELTKGYSMNATDLLNVKFTEQTTLVVARNIEFASICEHHLLPFYGYVNIGYFPRGKVVGLSKMPRVVDCYARRLQIQERMTRQIADAIDEVLKPRGLIVHVRGFHLCVKLRGARNTGTYDTVETRGSFEKSTTRKNFFELLAGSANGPRVGFGSVDLNFVGSSRTIND